jgi:asparagine synthase (glutamine-hydrolysing)
VKALLLAPGISREVDPEALHRYIAFGWVTGPETMFRGIRKLPPAHYMIWRAGETTIAPWWDLRFDVADDRPEAEIVESLREALTRAVERHLISDVPLGVFLSGGLDSSTILALATRITGAPVTAYTIAYRPQDGALEQSTDDALYARLMAERFGARYHEIVVAPDIVDLLPKVILHLDEPVADPAAIATYLICDAARAEVKVLLSGQGGDEIFAGYPVHRNHGLGNLVARLPRGIRNGPGRALLGALPALGTRIPGVRPGLAMAAHRYLDKLFAGAELSPEERYVFYRSYYTEAEARSMYAPALRGTVAGERAGVRHYEYFDTVPDADFLNRVLYVDLKTFLPELNLTYSDKMSSAASVEVRVPLLDNEVVDLAARIPPSLKLRGVTGKYIFKKAMEGILPDSVIHRRKAGFSAPIRSWLRRELRGMVDDLLSEETVRRRGYFDPRAVRRLVEQDRSGAADHTLRIWSLLTFELWQSTFVDGSFPK